MSTKPPGDTLTVVFRNDAPMAYAGDSPTYRSVRIKLTNEQRKQLASRFTHSSGGTNYFEEISRCFIEPEIES